MAPSAPRKPKNLSQKLTKQTKESQFAQPLSVCSVPVLKSGFAKAARHSFSTNVAKLSAILYHPRAWLSRPSSEASDLKRQIQADFG